MKRAWCCLLTACLLTSLVWGALPASDDFERASLGSSWYVYGSWIDDGHDAKTTSGSDTVMFWTADTFQADQYAEVVLGTPGNYVGAAVRASQSPMKYYGCYVNGSRYYLFRVGPGYTTLATAAGGSYTAGSTIRVEASASNPTHLACYYNGALLASADDSSANQLSSGTGGVTVDGANASVRSWAGGNLGAVTVSAARRRAVN